MVKYLTEARFQVSSEAFNRQKQVLYKNCFTWTKDALNSKTKLQRKFSKAADDHVNHFLFYDSSFIEFWFLQQTNKGKIKIHNGMCW